MSDRFKKILLDLRKIPGNDLCCDCGTPDPEWTSYNIGIFICETCAALHRALGAHISKVKSIKLDLWDEDQVKYMEAQGNLKAKEKYEQFVPVCYKKIQPSDPQVLREQWVRGKYERLEFMDPDKQSGYRSNPKEGFLYKRGKDDKKFQRRKFVLSETANSLKYFRKDDAKEPKAVLRIDDMNAVMAPDKIGNPNGMQITFEQDGHTRNLFLYAETGKEIVDWFHAIRSAKLNRLAIAYPGANAADLSHNLTHSFLHEGWLSKTGPRPGDAFRRRWLTLEKRKLMYYDDAMDAFPKGEIFIGYKDRGFEVRQGVPQGMRELGYPFTLRTPERHFHFSAETEDERDTWMRILRDLVLTPLSPQESSSNFGVKKGSRKSVLAIR